MKIPTFFLLMLCFTIGGCGAMQNTVVIKDLIQIRPIIPDDPLATKLTNRDGEEIRVGDVAVTEKHIDRIQVVEVGEGLFNLELIFRGVNHLRWKEYCRKNVRRESALIMKGKVWKTFVAQNDEDEEQSVFSISTIVESKEEAEELEKMLGL